MDPTDPNSAVNFIESENSTNEVINVIEGSDSMTIDENTVQFIQYINVPCMDLDNTAIVENNVGDQQIIIQNNELNENVFVNEEQMEYIIKNDDNVEYEPLEGHTIIVHEGRQYIIQNDQISDGGEIILDSGDNNIIIHNDQIQEIQPGQIIQNFDTEVQIQKEEQFENTVGELQFENVDDQPLLRINEIQDEYLEYSEEENQEISNDGSNTENNQFVETHFLSNLTAEIKDIDSNATTEQTPSKQKKSKSKKKKQFAVLKDGKLVIQEGCVDEQFKNNNFDSTFKSGIEEDNNFEEYSQMLKELGIAGKNLITGQTISLDTFIAKLASRSKDVVFPQSPVKVKQELEGAEDAFYNDGIKIPNKFNFGYTQSGKRIVGKIIQIKRPGQDPITPTKISSNVNKLKRKIKEDVGTHYSTQDNTSSIEEILVDDKGQIIPLNKDAIPDDIFFSPIKDMDPLTYRTVCGLMELESVQKNLVGRHIIVKNIHKKSKLGKIVTGAKTVKYFKGAILQVTIYDDLGQNVKHEWKFLPKNETASVNTATQKENDQEIDLNLNEDDPQTLNSDENENGESFEMEQVILDLGNADEGNEKEKEKKWTREIPPLTVNITIIEDEFGKKKTKVLIPNTDTMRQCQICKKEFRTVHLLRRHQKSAHTLDVSEKQQNRCDLCMKVFADVWTLTRHRHIHSGDKNYQCAQCMKAFNTAGSLKRHITVHDPSLRPLQCLTCMQRFTDQSSLKKHMVLHTGLKPFECDMCFKRFVHQGDLNFHRKIHDPLKHYMCDTCGKEFNRHSNLIRHLDIHNENGSFKCDMCGCSYNFISSLTRHIVNNHMKEA